MKNHLASHPLGANFYQLGHFAKILNMNSYVSIGSFRIASNPIKWPARRLVVVPRASLLYIDGKFAGCDYFTPEFQANLVMQAAIRKVVGTAFALRVMDWLITSVEMNPHELDRIKILRKNYRNFAMLNIL